MLPEFLRDDAFRLETRRLWLRLPLAADAAEMAGLARDWQVARLTSNIPHPYALEDAAAFIGFARAAAAAGEGLHAVLTLKTGARDLVGALGVEPREDGLEIGYWLGRAYWGQGLATEALAGLAQLLFLVTPAPAFKALALAENTASQAVLKRVGFERDGEAPASGRFAGRPALRFVLRRDSMQAAA